MIETLVSSVTAGHPLLQQLYNLQCSSNNVTMHTDSGKRLIFSSLHMFFLQELTAAATAAAGGKSVEEHHRI
jgi:hypothetical protein